MDFKTYDKVYQELLSKRGREEISDNPDKEKEVLDKINTFLDLYPKSIPKDLDPKAKIYQLSIKEIFKRTIQTAIDILNDISNLISKREFMSKNAFRREFFKTFTRKERRLYLGIWVIFFAFVLYFLDSAA